MLAIFDVDEEVLAQNGSFAGELGWVAESGIYLDDYCEVTEEQAASIMQSV